MRLTILFCLASFTIGYAGGLLSRPAPAPVQAVEAPAPGMTDYQKAQLISGCYGHYNGGPVILEGCLREVKRITGDAGIETTVRKP